MHLILVLVPLLFLHLYKKIPVSVHLLHLYRKIPMFVHLLFLYLLKGIPPSGPRIFYHIHKKIPMFVHLLHLLHLLHLHKNYKCHKNTLDNSLYNKIPIYQRLSQFQDTYVSNTSPKIQDMYCNLLH